MKIEVSIGEAIDKLSILDIKYKRIDDLSKRIEIQKEIEVLEMCREIIDKFPLYYRLLTFVNEKIWDMTDIIKSIEYTDPNFAFLSNEIFVFNQKRFRLKSFFNSLTNSNIKEQKSYSLSHLRINIDSIETLYKKIPEINALSIEYDTISFDLIYENAIRGIFNQPNIIYDVVNNCSKSINLSDICLNENERDVFEFDTIKYVCGGLLGDFINSLSVPLEYFKLNGRRATIYLAHGFDSDHFRYGLEKAYSDLFNTISSQFYIKEFKIYSGEIFDVNLNLWRKSNKLLKENLYQVYKSTYNIDWGKDKWLNVRYDEKWEDKTVVNTTAFRFPDNVDFHELYNKYSDKMIFVSDQKSEYSFFIEKTGINIEYYNPSSFEELSVIINSCQLFIGSLSSPLTIAFALHKKLIIGLNHSNQDRICDSTGMTGLEHKFNNIII
jgi:hypothetical protein